MLWSQNKKILLIFWHYGHYVQTIVNKKLTDDKGSSTGQYMPAYNKKARISDMLVSSGQVLNQKLCK